MDRAASHGQRVFGWCADLTVSHLPVGRFDVIVVTRYLQRDLCADLASALALNGVLLYETFTEQQRVHGRGPTSPDHLLRRGELLELFAGLETIAYEEVTEPDALSRLAARRRSNPS